MDAIAESWLAEIDAGALGDFDQELGLQLLDIVNSVGPRDAEVLLLEQLPITKHPLHFSILVDALESAAPGVYRELILDTTRELLRRAARGSPEYAESDVGPLFHVLQTYGDDSVLPDLQAALPRWKYYATVALSKLGDGEGIPTLVKLLRSPGVKDTLHGRFVLDMLAQATAVLPQARVALLEQARTGAIPAGAWPRLAEILAGNYRQHIGSPADWQHVAGVAPTANRYTIQRVDNQITGATELVYAAHVTSTPSLDEIDERLALIDEILIEASSAPGIDALDQAYASLLGSAY